MSASDLGRRKALEAHGLTLCGIALLGGSERHRSLVTQLLWLLREGQDIPPLHGWSSWLVLTSSGQLMSRGRSGAQQGRSCGRCHHRLVVWTLSTILQRLRMPSSKHLLPMRERTTIAVHLVRALLRWGTKVRVHLSHHLAISLRRSLVILMLILLGSPPSRPGVDAAPRLAVTSLLLLLLLRLLLSSKVATVGRSIGRCTVSTAAALIGASRRRASS